jgi:hypothetical protein
LFAAVADGFAYRRRGAASQSRFHLAGFARYNCQVVKVAAEGREAGMQPQGYDPRRQ